MGNWEMGWNFRVFAMEYFENFMKNNEKLKRKKRRKKRKRRRK